MIKNISFNVAFNARLFFGGYCTTLLSHYSAKMRELALLNRPLCWVQTLIMLSPNFDIFQKCCLEVHPSIQRGGRMKGEAAGSFLLSFFINIDWIFVEFICHLWRWMQRECFKQCSCILFRFVRSKTLEHVQTLGKWGGFLITQNKGRMSDTVGFSHPSSFEYLAYSFFTEAFS